MKSKTNVRQIQFSASFPLLVPMLVNQEVRVKGTTSHLQWRPSKPSSIPISQAPSPGEDGPVFSARFLQGCLVSAFQGLAILSQSF